MNWMAMLLALPALALHAFAFQPAETTKPPKPTPKEKAAELLQAALDSAPGAEPEVAAAALLRIGENLDSLDPKKALEAMTRAFSVSLAIPPSDDARRERVQSLVVVAASQISLPEAATMLKRIQAASDDEPRQQAITTIANRLIETKKIPETIDLINAVGVTGQYPYSAAGAIFENLPKQDSRRLAVFGAAQNAYTLRPAEPFSEFVEKHWKDVPQSMSEVAVGAIVSHILNYKSDDRLLEMVATVKGTVTLRTRQDVELFDIIHVLRVFDPKRADEILATRPELKAALDRFPDGRSGMGQVINMTRTDSSAPEALTDALKAGQSGAQVGGAMGQIDKLFENLFDLPDDVARKNFMKALEAIKSISDPAARAQLLSSIIGAATDEPEIVKPVLADCMALLKDIQDASAKVDIWSNIIDVAHQVKDDKLTGEAIDGSLDNAAALFKRDTDADRPNTALVDEWPSANAYRKAMIGATKAFNVDADWVLARISDPRMLLYARIEMAQTLLDRPHSSWMQTYTPRTK